MKFGAAILTVAFLALSAFAGASVGLPSLTRDSWLYFGYCVVLLMCAAGLVFLARVNYATLRRLPLSLLVAFSLLAVCTSLDAEKTNRLAGVFCQLAELYESPRPRDLPGPTNAVTNFTITAYVVTTSNQYFEAAWPEGFIPHGSRIELHEKSPSLTNGWACVRQYVVEPGQTNLCDAIALTNGCPSSAFYRLYVDALAISFPLLPSTVRTSGYCLTVATSADSIPVVVERSERPQEYPAPDLGFAENPFVDSAGLSYDSTNGTVTTTGPGSFTLPTGDSLVVLSPSISFGTPHDYAGDTLVKNSLGGPEYYEVRSSYPLDEPCLWESWHMGTNSSFGCTCEPEFSFGADVSNFGEITNSVEVVDGVAIAKVFLGQALVWSNSCEHARYWPSGGRSDFLSNDGCSSCGLCADGNCDTFDGPSLGSVRFRISLGSSASAGGRLGETPLPSGFFWFDRDAVFYPSPSSFSLLKRPDAHVLDTTAGGVRTVACSDRGGRTIVVSNIVDGVGMAVTFTATGAKDRSWEVTRENGAMRFRKFNARGILMSDVSYSRLGGEWTATDNVSGLAETSVSTGKTLSWDNAVSRTVETVLTCGSVTGSHVRVTSELVGSDDRTVVRETERSEKRADGTWSTSYASYWDCGGSRKNGQVRMVWGDDRAWSWTDYDEEGREVFRLDQRDGSAAPEDEWLYSLDWLPEGVDSFATVVGYEPHPGDSCHANDWDKARTVSRYVVSDGAATLIARTWTLYVRGVAANGWPTVAETTIRACSQSAAIDDPGNAVSTVVRYDDESSLVPYLMRGETISETDEDGVTETHSHTILSNSVVRTVFSRTKDGHEAKTRMVTERDLAYGLTLYEATQLTAAPAVEFGWRRHVYDSRHRLRFTQYDDGSSETNAYDCCRLLFRIDRTGAKTLYCSTPETAHLYHAEEEVSLSSLPHDDKFIPYEAGTGSSLDTAHRVVQHFSDCFGRETGTVTRVCRYDGSSANPNFTHPYGWRTYERYEYPDGVAGISVFTDARLSTTMLFEAETQAYSVSSNEVRSADGSLVKVSVSISPRGGSSSHEERSGDVWRRTATMREYTEDGCSQAISVSESPDFGSVSNSVTAYDFLGRVVSVRTPTSTVTNIYDGASSRILSTFDAVSGVTALSLYDDIGELVGEVRSGVSSVSEREYEVVSGVCWRVSSQVVYSGGETNSRHVVRERLTGLSDAMRSETVEMQDGVVVLHSTSAFSPETLVLVETNESAVSGISVARSKFGRVFEVSSSAGRVCSYFDPYGRVYHVERDIGDGTLRNAEWTGRNSAGDVEELDTFYAPGKSAYVAAFYGYDCMGNRIASTNEIGNVVMRTCDADGRVTSESGDTYPLVFGYDSSGRRTALSTTRDGVNFDVTSWGYDAVTGSCTNKVYADGSAETYSHTSDALPLRRTSPDGGWTENVYDANRRRVGQMSSDPSCEYGLFLDSFGRTVAASNSVVRYAYSLANCGVATNETASVGLESFSVMRSVDAYGRVVTLSRDGVEDAVVYSPTNGTIAAISNAEAYVTYAYTSDLLDAGCELTLADGMRFSRDVRRNSLYSRENVHAVTNCAASATNEFRYAFDALNRPVSRNSDAFAYNRRGEVASALVGGLSATYAYDGIGNATASVWNGATTTYSANALNQYELAAKPGDSAWMHYLENGELAYDGRRNYFYDAKSRLVAVGEWVFDEDRYHYDDYDDYDELWSFDLAVSNRYDYLDRRVQKITSAATHTYFYDGWLLIKETVANTNGTTDVIEYHWGKDLSGTIGGAGGVGGLLYLKRNGAIYVPWYDAYGNVMGYWDAQGNVVAEYTYDAFGKLISSSGPMADVFAIRYSTKYFDLETGLYYYGYRFYSPELMRWITRDPIGEEGGELSLCEASENLYCFLSNDAIGDYDYLGLTSSKKQRKGWKYFGHSHEFHNWDCYEWKPDYGTTSKYVKHFKDITFTKEIKVPGEMVSAFAKSVVAALEMNNDATSYWCISLAPLIVQTRMDDNKRKYRIKMYVVNFDKHPECKGAGKREEIHQTNFEKKWVYYELQ